MGVGFNSNWAEGDYTDRRNQTLQNIAELRLQINLCVTEEEKEAFQMALKLEVQQLERTNKEHPFATWAKEVMLSNGTLNPIDTVYGYNTISNTKRLIQSITINHHQQLLCFDLT